uniref:Uncharacterized protein n=1 Tax=Rhizophora mucronata TaxID=61149 RepID=A0A2P2QTY5_RHIMU
MYMLIVIAKQKVIGNQIRNITFMFQKPSCVFWLKVIWLSSTNYSGPIVLRSMFLHFIKIQSAIFTSTKFSILESIC